MHGALPTKSQAGVAPAHGVGLEVVVRMSAHVIRASVIQGIKSSKQITRTKLPAPPNYPLRHPNYHLIEAIRPLMEVHWGSRCSHWFTEVLLAAASLEGKIRRPTSRVT